MAMNAVGLLTGPPVLGATADHTGLTAIFAAGAVLLALTTLFAPREELRNNRETIVTLLTFVIERYVGHSLLDDLPRSSSSSTWSSQHAVGGGSHVGAHVAAHHSQRRVGEFGVDVRDAVERYRDAEVAHVGIERAVEDALLGDLAAQEQA
jgi:hypothetical protein